MAVLSVSDRAAARHEFSNRITTSIALTKPELLAALNAVDVWVDDNAAAFNLAIPQPARGVLTAKQKAQLLSLVVARRFEVTP
jgi:hypothetical protein